MIKLHAGKLVCHGGEDFLKGKKVVDAENLQFGFENFKKKLLEFFHRLIFNEFIFF
jgi:hypothetical protein